MGKKYYFSHDSNARNDEKILNLRSEHGFEGYGIYFALLEMMFEADESKLKFSSIKAIAYDFHMDPKKLENIIDFCINEKLFEKNVDYFWSNGLIQRKSIYERKIEQTRQAGIRSAEKRKAKKEQILNEETTQVERPLNEPATNKIKLNKTKLNKKENENVLVESDQSDSCVDEIVDFYNNNIGAATQYSFQVLKDYEREMGTELVIYAMQKAVDSNVRNIRYIKAILNNWNNKGIKTLIEAQQEWKDKEDNSSVDWGKMYDNLIPKEGEKNAD